MGDALAEMKLAMKSKTYSITTDQFAQAIIALPEDCTIVLRLVSAASLVLITGVFAKSLNLRCFGSIPNLKLDAMRSTNISVTLYYL